MSNMDYIADIDGNQILIETQQKGTREEVTELFRRYRKDLGLTQVELSKLAGVSQPNITRFEGGNYNPTLEFMVKLAAAMGKRVKVTLED